MIQMPQLCWICKADYDCIHREPELVAMQSNKLRAESVDDRQRYLRELEPPSILESRASALLVTDRIPPAKANDSGTGFRLSNSQIKRGSTLG